MKEILGASDQQSAPPPVAEGHLCSPSPSKKQKGFASPPPRGGDSLFAGCRTQATHLRTMWDLTETQGPRGRERGGSFQSNTDTQTSKNVNTEWETFARPPDPVPAAEGSLQRGWTSRARLRGGGGRGCCPACASCLPHLPPTHALWAWLEAGCPAASVSGRGGK